MLDYKALRNYYKQYIAHKITNPNTYMHAYWMMYVDSISTFVSFDGQFEERESTVTEIFFKKKVEN